MRYLSDHFSLVATNLSNHLSCEHLTQLSRRVALKEISKPTWRDPSLEVLIKRGEEHEAAYVDYLKNKKGFTSVYLKGKPLDATIDAMKQGIDVITQPLLEVERWSGFADILIKVPGKSKFGNWSYEVQDTKLSQ